MLYVMGNILKVPCGVLSTYWYCLTAVYNQSSKCDLRSLNTFISHTIFILIQSYKFIPEYYIYNIKGMLDYD